MPRKSKKSQGTSLSQKSTLQKSTLTQQTLEENFGDSNVDIEDETNNLVRYIINRAGNHLPIKQTEIKKNVLSKTGTKYQKILQKTSEVLKNVYGYNMLTLDGGTTSSQEYVISNALPYIGDPRGDTDEGYPEDSHKVLLLLILSHIFMSNGTVSEVSLDMFLNSFKIDVEKTHEVFGNIKEYIHQNLKNKKYLKIEMEQTSKKNLISWGPRAEKEISKHEVLNFVCKIYKNRLPNTWTNQFRVAEEQGFENHKST